MKTIVRIIKEDKGTKFKKGDEGYIDGYILGKNNWPFAVVICGNELDLVDLNCLKVLQSSKC